MGDVGLPQARLLTLLALCGLGAGCGHPACAPGTVLVSLSLEGAAAAADALEVELTVDGAAQTRTVMRPAAGASQASERLALTFGGGSAYPSGRALALTVTALAAGVPLAEAEDHFTAEPSCTARRLTLGAPPADGSPSGDGASSDGSDDGSVPGCPGCQLTALGPAIAPAGATLTLEGTFGAAASVQFPGAAALTPATVLGPHRAQVVVPDDAGEGALTVVSGGVTLGPLRFRRASFGLGLGRFNFEYAQADGPRPRPFLHSQHVNHPSWVVGSSLYVAGIGSSPTLERATLNADGTLSSFASLPGVTLTAERQGAVALCLGSYCYAIGGTDNGTPVSTVERASIGADGRLSTFAVVPGVTLTSPRWQAAHAVIGNYLYVIAGADPKGVLPITVDRASIAPDGSISTFEQVPEVAIDTGRYEPRALVSGGWVYLLGGRRNGVGLDRVERASISPDGTISTFTRNSNTGLVTGRGGCGVAVLGSTVFLVGGNQDDATSLSSIEKAAIAPDGSLGSFVTASVGLTVPRFGLSLVQAGNLLTAVGGRDAAAGGYHLGVEQANIDVSGALDAFAASAPALVTPRFEHAAALAGRSLYLFGGGDGSGPLTSLERAGFEPDGALGAFAAGPSLLVGRSSLGAVISGSWLYVYGGDASDIERAPVDADGALGAFTLVSGASLSVPRYGFASVALGSWLYLLGGVTLADGQRTTGIERAPINVDGSLGAFANTSGSLYTARFKPMVVVSGNYLYVLGGTGDSGTLDTVERASINTDGTISGFSDVPSVHLATPREGASAVALANWLYVLGGTDGSFPTTIEAAPFNADGSLGAFTTAGATLAAGHYSAAALQLGNSLYVLGGEAQSNHTIAPSERATLK